MPGELSGKAAIVGIGATDFSKNSGRSEVRLASEAVLDALDDAGLTPADVDGVIVDDELTPRTAPVNEITAALGIERTFSVHGPPAGSAYTLAPMLAAMAMAAGQGSVFVSYLALAALLALMMEIPTPMPS